MIFREELFHNKHILVTGANSGLGLYLSLELLELGARVTGISRTINKEQVSKLYGEKWNNKFDFFSLDFGNDRIDFKSLELCNPYDGIFFSAGISEVSSFTKVSEDKISSTFNVNVISQLKLLRFLLKMKLINKCASVVFMSSINGTSTGSKGHSIYCATKGAINGVTMSLSNELSSKSIRVNSIAAGLVKTPMFLDNLRLAGSDSMKDYEKTYPLGFGEPQDISNFGVYLLSEGAKWITGQTFIIDGGHSIS